MGLAAEEIEDSIFRPAPSPPWPSCSQSYRQSRWVGRKALGPCSGAMGDGGWGVRGIWLCSALQ